MECAIDERKEQAVIANIAIRALCCFRALSFGYCCHEDRVGPQNGVIKRKQKNRNREISREMFQVCAPFESTAWL